MLRQWQCFDGNGSLVGWVDSDFVIVDEIIISAIFAFLLL